MFRECIMNTALTGDDANLFFNERITGDSFYNDVSFVSTLRAMLGHKMKPEDRVRFRVTIERFSEDDYECSAEDVARSWLDSTRHNQITFINSTSSKDANTFFFDAFDKIPEIDPTWEKVNKLSIFFAENFRISCFINSEMRSCFIFTERFDLRKYHYVQGAIPVMIPWYFNGEYKPTEEEKEQILRPLATALNNGDGAKDYRETIKKIEQAKYNLRAERTKRYLTGFETKRIGAQVQCMQQDVDNKRSEVENLLERIRNYEIEIERLNATICGFKTMQNTGAKSELCDYFLSIPSLYVRGVTNSQIDFIYKGYMTSPSPETAREIENLNSYLYDNCGEFTKEQLQSLLRAVFITQEIKLRVCARIVLRVPGGIHKDSSRGFNYGEYGDEYADYMPNTHLDQYGCFGGHYREVSELVNMGDYISAVAQCMESVESFDLNDSAVGKKFARNVSGCEHSFNTHAFELPDGSVVNPADAIKYLEERS